MKYKKTIVCLSLGILLSSLYFKDSITVGTPKKNKKKRSKTTKKKPTSQKKSPSTKRSKSTSPTRSKSTSPTRSKSTTRSTSPKTPTSPKKTPTSPKPSITTTQKDTAAEMSKDTIIKLVSALNLELGLTNEQIEKESPADITTKAINIIQEKYKDNDTIYGQKKDYITNALLNFNTKAIEEITNNIKERKETIDKLKNDSEALTIKMDQLKKRKERKETIDKLKNDREALTIKMDQLKTDDYKKAHSNNKFKNKDLEDTIHKGDKSEVSKTLKSKDTEGAYKKDIEIKDKDINEITEKRKTQEENIQKANTILNNGKSLQGFLEKKDYEKKYEKKYSDLLVETLYDDLEYPDKYNKSIDEKYEYIMSKVKEIETVYTLTDIAGMFGIKIETSTDKKEEYKDEFFRKAENITTNTFTQQLKSKLFRLIKNNNPEQIKSIIQLHGPKIQEEIKKQKEDKAARIIQNKFRQKQEKGKNAQEEAKKEVDKLEEEKKEAVINFQKALGFREEGDRAIMTDMSNMEQVKDHLLEKITGDQGYWGKAVGRGPYVIAIKKYIKNDMNEESIKAINDMTQRLNEAKNKEQQ